MPALCRDYATAISNSLIFIMPRSIRRCVVFDIDIVKYLPPPSTQRSVIRFIPNNLFYKDLEPVRPLYRWCPFRASQVRSLTMLSVATIKRMSSLAEGWVDGRMNEWMNEYGAFV